jgi:uncharacterized protein YcaQ
MPKDKLTAGEARRIALAAQGFGAPRPDGPVGKRQLLKLIERLGVVQIDSVNVVSRTHYLPAFSRLGAYPRALLEEVAWGKKPALLEYWGHEASLTPMTTQPLLRWRMEDARNGVGVWKGIARFLRERRDLADRALSEIETRGPLAASDLEVGLKGAGGWWGWSDAKRAVEGLFWTGELTTATRRGTFERVYGLPEKVLPRAIISLPTPPRDEAQRELYRIAIRAMGVATAKDLRDYFRMPVEGAKARLAELVEDGSLLPVTVKGWREQAYLDPAARWPRRIDALALLSPFDNLIWFRERTERMFGVRYRIEIYTPAAKRTHGYYVLPFLEGDALTARVDLKADRKAGVLVVQASHAEPWAGDATPVRLAQELKLMAGWLGLERVRVEKRGDLAAALAKAVGSPLLTRREDDGGGGSRRSRETEGARGRRTDP